MGKPQPTAMIAWVLTRLGIDPSYIIGSNAINLGGNAHAGKQRPASLFGPTSTTVCSWVFPHDIAVVTGLQHDHPGLLPERRLHDEAFTLRKAGRPRWHPPGCKDDPAQEDCFKISPVGRQRPLLRLERSAGEAQPDYIASSLERNGQGGTTYSVRRRYTQGAEEILPVKGELKSRRGRHNVLNALAVIGVAHLLELPLAAGADGSWENSVAQAGVSMCAVRRNGVVVIDDYAHHPDGDQGDPGGCV